MTALIGKYSLILAAIFAFVQSVFPLWGYYKKNAYAKACARPALLGQFFFVLTAYGLLTWAFINNDFSLVYVTNNSHATLPFLYRLTAVWGGHEGSILLWILMLNVWSMIYTLTQRKNLDPLVLSVLGTISFCFLLFLLMASNPFVIASVQTAAQDLNPLLQDPGFIIHPPMLYMGYVGFCIAFALTEAALIRGELNSRWAYLTRQFALAAWCFLTLGIALGSWWAYRVLGWGGFWFWDPVENASLLPWLMGTALIHLLLVVEKRGAGDGTAALLAIICFALSILGTFLVRSGVLISVHTFATDPTRGIFLLLLLAVLIFVALLRYVKQLPTFRSLFTLALSWRSREVALLSNTALLTLAMLIILLGTLYPLIVDALQQGAISVGAPYFNKVMQPLICILMLIMGFAPHLAWQQEQNTKKNRYLFLMQLVFSVIGALILLWSVTHKISFIPLLSLSLCSWIILSLRKKVRLFPGMSFAHAGFAILVLGIMLSSTLNETREVRLKPGDMAQVGPYHFLFLDTTGVQGSNYRGIQAAFDVSKGERHITNLYPEKRIYLVRDMVMTKVDIHPGIFRDLYIALGEPLENDYWSLRIYYKPFIRFIWMGALIMIFGGLMTLLKRRVLTMRTP